MCSLVFASFSPKLKGDELRANNALLTDTFSLLRCGYGAAKRER